MVRLASICNKNQDLIADLLSMSLWLAEKFLVSFLLFKQSMFTWVFSLFFYTAIIFAGIAFSWLLAVLNALLRNFIKWKDVSIVNTFAFFVVPLLLIVAAYIAIFFAAKKSLKEHRRRSLKKVISNFLSVTQRSIASLVNTSCLDYFFLQWDDDWFCNCYFIFGFIFEFTADSILETFHQVRR